MNISEKCALLLLLAAALALSAVSVAWWKVDALSVTEDGGRILYSLPVPNGYRFTAYYTHSVELTPVEDEYCVADGALWSWQERVKSSNAGMPSIAPRNGRFINSGEWLIFQGGRVPMPRLYLRVGDERFGRNRLTLPPHGTSFLYRETPGARLVIAAEKQPLARIAATGLDSLENR